MKIIYSDLSADYSTYTFPYAIYAQVEVGDQIETIYQAGFLPYSANIHIRTPTFYLARSLRVNLEHFSDTSENRRVDNLNPSDDLIITLLPKSEFKDRDLSTRKLCSDYIEERFPPDTIPKDRFEYIMYHPLATHFLEYRRPDGHLVAIVFCSVHADIVHYWFAFFDLNLMKTFPFGKWVMWKTLQWVKENGYSHLYLGSCYGIKSLYKVRDFKGVEFFDGEIWNPDVNELKCRVKGDEEPFALDRWKRENRFD